MTHFNNFAFFRFADTYFNGRPRAYGANIGEVFEKLYRDAASDPFKPAREQFGGSGSYGNGGAMRVAPVALFYAHDRNEMIKVIYSTKFDFETGNLIGGTETMPVNSYPSAWHDGQLASSCCRFYSFAYTV